MRSRFGFKVLAVMVAVSVIAMQPLAAATYHVKTNGVDGVNDGLSWGAAFATISNAVAKATTLGDVVLVSNGLYSITAQITVTNPITVASVNGAANTVVRRGSVSNFRCFFVSNTTAVVDGFTITNGLSASPNPGGGLYVYGATIRNCSIRGNVCNAGGNSEGGGGLWVQYGIVSNCVVAENTSPSGYGGGIKAHTDTLVTHCTIFGNYATSRGGGVDMQFAGANGKVRNSLIYSNAVRTTPTSTAGAAGGPAVMLLGAGALENCTITRNTCRGDDTNYPCAVGTTVGRPIVNCIIYDNNYTVATPTNFGATAGGVAFIPYVTNSCLEFAWASGTNNIAANPSFTNPGGADFSLQRTSPCVNAGTNLAWITSGASDLSGGPRLIGSRVDIGAYETLLTPIATSVTIR